MENKFGYIISLLFGILLIVKFKQLGDFSYKQNKNLPSVIPDKWSHIITRSLVLVVGIIFIIISIVKLIKGS